MNIHFSYQSTNYHFRHEEFGSLEGFCRREVFWSGCCSTPAQRTWCSRPGRFQKWLTNDCTAAAKSLDVQSKVFLSRGSVAALPAQCDCEKAKQFAAQIVFAHVFTYVFIYSGGSSFIISSLRMDEVRNWWTCQRFSLNCRLVWLWHHLEMFAVPVSAQLLRNYRTPYSCLFFLHFWMLQIQDLHMSTVAKGYNGEMCQGFAPQRCHGDITALWSARGAKSKRPVKLFLQFPGTVWLKVEAMCHES